MKTCTFFGHRDCPDSVKALLYETVEKLIVQDGAEVFYVGNQGAFDRYVRSVLKKLAVQYPHIRYAVVLSCLPAKKVYYEDYSDTMYPEGLEKGPPRFAIERRNKWMLAQSDIVVSFVRVTWGGAWKFTQMAQKQGKRVINLYTNA